MRTSSAPRWRKPVFLGVSALLAATVVVAAHEVMLPFVLALLIAYVLTPLVARVERRRVPRPLAIAAVYAVVLGSMGGLMQGIAPRIELEFRNLRGELPALAAEARQKWVPAVTERLRALGIVPAQVPPPEDSPEAGPTSAFFARPQPDGTIAIDVGTGVSVTETAHGYVVEPTRDKRDEPFDPDKVIADVMGKTFAYAQENSLA